MKITSIFLILIFLCTIVSSQDTIIDFKTYKVIPGSNLNRDQILLKVIKEKAYDYWEYRQVCETQTTYCFFDSIDCIPSIIYKYNVLARGDYRDKNDSIKLSNISCRDGFWWIPPAGEALYLLTIQSNKLDSIVNRDNLFELLKPFNSIDKICLYFDSYIPLKYKRNKDSFELIIYDRDKPTRYYENKRGYFNVYEKSYFRVLIDGRYYKKKIGEYHLKSKGPYLIP
jgi:hypothetical protein